MAVSINTEVTGGGDADIGGFSPFDSDVINVMDSKYGARGDAEGGQDGQWRNSFLEHYTPKRPYTSKDVNKSLWLDGSNKRTIVSVGGDGWATLNSAGYSQAGWVRGTDDTAAVRAALLDCTSSDSAEDSSGFDRCIKKGKTLYIPAGINLLVGCTQAEYGAGRVAALYMPRRTTIMGSGLNGGSIFRLPGSYGHLISNNDPVGSADNELSYSDFLEIRDLVIHDLNGWSPNGLDTIHWNIPFNGWDTVDPYNRITNVRIWEPCRDGIYARGRGEAVFDRVNIINAARYGVYFQNLTDWRWVNGNIAGAKKTGMRLYSAGPATIADSKVYYCGISGTTSEEDSCNILLDGDQYLNGAITLSNVECQESRGSALVIKTGLNQISGRFEDPGRNGMTSGSPPTVIAGIHLKGTEARQNIFNNAFIVPNVAIWSVNNWGIAQNAVHIDAANGSGGGPNLNVGDIYTMRPTTASDGSTKKGIDYTASYAPVGGAGSSNGKNTGLRVNGVACT